MNNKKIILLLLLFSIPLLVMSLHLLSESVYFGVTRRDFLGFTVSLNFLYDIVFYLIIILPIICILIFLREEIYDQKEENRI